MDYKATTSEITQIADAIREKTETSDLLEFPDDFVSAIRGIETKGTLEVSRVYLGKVQSYASANMINSSGINFAKSESDTSTTTLGELIEDKTIIGFEIVPVDETFSLSAPMLGAYGMLNGVAVDVIANQEGDVRSNIGMSIYFYSNKDLANQGSGTYIKVYAVCLSIA